MHAHTQPTTHSQGNLLEWQELPLSALCNRVLEAVVLPRVLLVLVGGA